MRETESDPSLLSVLAGLSLVESYPYEPEERGSDYVRLASIAAGDWRAATATSAFSASTQREASYSATQKYTLVPTKVIYVKEGEDRDVILHNSDGVDGRMCSEVFEKRLMSNIPHSASVLPPSLWASRRASMCCC